MTSRTLKHRATGETHCVMCARPYRGETDWWTGHRAVFDTAKLMEKGHRYQCVGNCGREWKGEAGWWVTMAMASLEEIDIDRGLYHDVMCLDCYQQSEALNTQ
jgi:hypothetical protein